MKFETISNFKLNEVINEKNKQNTVNKNCPKLDVCRYNTAWVVLF